MPVAPISLPQNCPVATQWYGMFVSSYHLCALIDSSIGGGDVEGCKTYADLKFGDFELPQHAMLGVSNISESFYNQSSFMRSVQVSLSRARLGLD